jgi:hypothetical protein
MPAERSPRTFGGPQCAEQLPEQRPGTGSAAACDHDPADGAPASLTLFHAEGPAGIAVGRLGCHQSRTSQRPWPRLAEQARMLHGNDDTAPYWAKQPGETDALVLGEAIDGGK